MSEISKTLIIGWDGATWAYIDPLLAQGRLPNLARLLRNGSRFTLRSTLPPYTNVAWPSLVTGLWPTQTGIFDASSALPGSYDVAPTNLAGHRGAPIWRWTNQFGLRCGVLNVPMTFPAAPLEGYLVSGFDSVVESPQVAFPRDLLQRWSAEGRTYITLREEVQLMDSQNPHHERGDLESFVSGWVELTQQQGEMVRWLWDAWPVDLMFVVFSGTDSINHRTHDREAIARVHEAADAALGAILDGAGEQTLVCLLSDHGSTPATHYLSVYRALHDAGWLKFRPRVAERHWRRLPGGVGRAVAAAWRRLPDLAQRLLSWPLLRWDHRLAAAYENIDWRRTAVYARTGMGPLYINRAGRRPQGIVAESEYERLRDEVIQYFSSLRDTRGDRVFATIQRYEELYGGGPNEDDDRPDLIFTPVNWRDHPITGFPSDPLKRPIAADKPYGTHTPDGILLLHGPGITAGTTPADAEIVDVVPTLLAALDLPLPKGVDGRPLAEAFVQPPQLKWADPLPDRRPSEHAAAGSDASREISERLRALGYME